MENVVNKCFKYDSDMTLDSKVVFCRITLPESHWSCRISKPSGIKVAQSFKSVCGMFFSLLWHLKYPKYFFCLFSASFDTPLIALPPPLKPSGAIQKTSRRSFFDHINSSFQPSWQHYLSLDTFLQSRESERDPMQEFSIGIQKFSVNV